MFESLLIKALVGIIGLFGGASALENLLENYLMDKVPAWAKPMVVPVVAFIFTVVSAIYGGLPWDQALAAGFALWGGTVTLHNVPATTSRDTDPFLPAPPASADGLPDLKVE